MDWKQFLKPDLKKMILTLLLCIGFFFSWEECDPGYWCSLPESIAFILILPLEISHKTGFDLFICNYFSERLTCLFPFFIINVIYLYFLSCIIVFILSHLIVWIYNKRKK